MALVAESKPENMKQVVNFAEQKTPGVNRGF